MNQYAQIRECLFRLLEEFPLTNEDETKMQASLLSQLTDATNQLTQNAVVSLIGFSISTSINSILVDRCRELFDRSEKVS